MQITVNVPEQYLVDIDVIGSLGVLILAKSRNVIPAVGPLLERIRAAGNHLSDTLVSEALRLSGEA